MWSAQTIALIHAAADEDLGATGDISARLLPAADKPVAAQVVPRAAGVICGLALAPEVCRVFSERLDAALRFEPLSDPALARPFEDGDRVSARQTVGLLHGPKAAVLSTERTLLNFLGRMSGVATLTRRFVDAARAANPHVQILDTRKTLPGWRKLDKYAVRCGGGANHRFGLHDAVLIKDNHLAGIPTERLASELFELLNRLPHLTPPQTAIQSSASERSLARPPKFVEVEVDGLNQFDQVCKVVGVDIVLLDNFSLDDMREAVRRRDALGLRGKLLLEASGGVTLESVPEIVGTGIDRISVGALTHSAPAFDLGLDF